MGNIGSCKISESYDQKLLGVNIDCNLKFSHYILKQCKKAGGKLSALTRICKFMSLERRRVLMKSFIESQFAYCPLVWMCCDGTSDNRINHLLESALRSVYNDNVSKFEKLLEKDNSVKIHVRNLTILAKELHKTKENLAAPIMYEGFKQRNIPYGCANYSVCARNFLPPFSFIGINFRGMLHHVCGVAYDEKRCGPIRTRKCRDI